MVVFDDCSLHFLHPVVSLQLYRSTIVRVFSGNNKRARPNLFSNVPSVLFELCFKPVCTIDRLCCAFQNIIFVDDRMEENSSGILRRNAIEIGNFFFLRDNKTTKIIFARVLFVFPYHFECKKTDVYPESNFYQRCLKKWIRSSNINNAISFGYFFTFSRL